MHPHHPVPQYLRPEGQEDSQEAEPGVEIKDKLDEAEEIKEGHKKENHADQHKCKEVQE